jgi:hypothetical protein
MAYSENIKKLAISLCQDGQSPEDVARFFSRYLLEGQEKGYASLKKLAESKSLAFTEIDWQELNENLPEGKTIRGWYSRNKSKPAIQDLPQEIPTIKEKELELAQQEHIRKIQNLARNAYDKTLWRFPALDEKDERHRNFYECNDFLVKIIRRLTGDFEWKNLKEHLGEEGLEIEEMARIMNDTIPGLTATRNLSFKEYYEVVFKAYSLLRYKNLKVITETCDTKIWKRFGLQPVCKNCPDQGHGSEETVQKA